VYSFPRLAGTLGIRIKIDAAGGDKREVWVDLPIKDL
jgi:hypothetical protein